MPPRLSAVASLLFASIWCAWAAEGGPSGRVTDTQDKPFAGAKLRLMPPSGAAIEVNSDAYGRFVFGSVPQATTGSLASRQGSRV